MAANGTHWSWRGHLHATSTASWSRLAGQHTVERASSGLRVRTLRAVTWLGGHPAHPLAPGLPLFLARARANVVHTHHMRSLPSRMAVTVGRTRATRAVVTDHGLQGSSWGGLLPRLFDMFLTVSAYSARELRAPLTRTRVIYGGADPERFAPDPRVARRGVLFVGRLTPHKGVDRLLQALPENAYARVVGSGGHDPQPPEREYPDLLLRLARDKNVEFVGRRVRRAGCRRSIAPRRFSSCRPSRSRATASALPSRSCLAWQFSKRWLRGRRSLPRRVGGVPEIVRDGETGFLVPPGDVAQLRDRLSQVLGDPALARRLGDNARQDVLDRFTWRAVAERCLAAYSHAVDAQVR